MAIAPVAGAAVESKGQIKSNKDAVERIVGFSSYNRDRLDTLIAAVTCDYFEGAVVEVCSRPLTPSPSSRPPTTPSASWAGPSSVPGGLTPENVCSVDSLLGEGTLLQRPPVPRLRR